MAKEIRINARYMIKWILRKWMFAVPAVIVLVIFLMFSMVKQEANEYEEKTQYLYTMDELRELMTEKDYDAVQRALAADDLLAEKNDELEIVKESEPTEENLVRQMELLSELGELNQLRSDFIVYFSPIQSRYYWLYTGAEVQMREDFQRPSGISKKIIVFSLAGGVVFVAAVMVLVYLLLGYLHAQEELEVNFGYDVYDVSLKDDELLEKVRFIVKAEGLQNVDNLVVTGTVNWTKEDNKNVKNSILEETHAVFVDRITESVEYLESLNEKKILLVERANESKLRRIQDNDLVIRKAKGDVVGVIFIS